MSAITSGVYFRHKLEKRIQERMQAIAVEAMEFPEDGSGYWQRVGQYNALLALFRELGDLDRE